MTTLSEYMRKPYTVVLRRDDDGDFVAFIDELPGCMAHGSTKEEALEILEEMQEAWISERLESGLSIPEPEPEAALPSGKWVQRTPRSLHKKLASLAKKENVSLNQLVTSILSKAVGVADYQVQEQQRAAQLLESIWPSTRETCFQGSANLLHIQHLIKDKHGFAPTLTPIRVSALLENNPFRKKLLKCGATYYESKEKKDYQFAKEHLRGLP